MKITFSKAVASLAAVAILAGCGSNAAAATPAGTAASPAASEAAQGLRTGFATGNGFSAHGDVAFAEAEVDQDNNLVSLNMDEYFGIRSVGRILNNLEKASDEEKAMVAALPQEDVVYSDDGKYVAWKYLEIDGRFFECLDAGKNTWKEIGDGASIDDLSAYIPENTDWWVAAMQSAPENGATLRVAQDGDEVFAEIDGVKLAKQDELKSFYGTLLKSEGYTKNFNPASGQTDDWANSMKALCQYIVDNNGISADLEKAANADDKSGFVDMVSGATFGEPQDYIAVAKAAIADAESK